MDWGSWLLIFSIIILAGVIAYLGDILGRRIGKKKLSLFKLRPRYTAILVSVITGILIAAITLTILSVASQDVRTALFGMKELKDQIEQLEQREKELQSSKAVLEEQVKICLLYTSFPLFERFSLLLNLPIERFWYISPIYGCYLLSFSEIDSYNYFRGIFEERNRYIKNKGVRRKKLEREKKDLFDCSSGFSFVVLWRSFSGGSRSTCVPTSGVRWRNLFPLRF